VSLVSRLLGQRETDLDALQEAYPSYLPRSLDAHITATGQRIRAADIHDGAVSDRVATRLANLVRTLEADTVVETGVASGLSTTGLLAGAAETGGTVHSIDLPFRAGEDIETRRNETYDEFGGAHIPADADAGWAIPDGLRGHWRFYEGKSQRLLPEVLVDVGELDLFVHDSEHSRLCMSFELEAAWPRLRDGGVVVCDDLSWSGAWEEFCERRVADGRHGRLAPDVGYAIKGEP
jgi:predicted O-methyltransferase YrrM